MTEDGGSSSPHHSRPQRRRANLSDHHRGSNGIEPDQITREVIGAAISVHRELGPGLLESIYQKCLAHELAQRGLSIEIEKKIPIIYKGLMLNDHYRIDLIVEQEVVVELKTVSEIARVHEAQTLTYMRLTGSKLGLILNFNTYLMKDGIKRLIL